MMTFTLMMVLNVKTNLVRTMTIAAMWKLPKRRKKLNQGRKP